jgi:hypothetical protein
MPLLQQGLISQGLLLQTSEHLKMRAGNSEVKIMVKYDDARKYLTVKVVAGVTQQQQLYEPPYKPRGTHPNTTTSPWFLLTCAGFHHPALPLCNLALSLQPTAD